MNSLELPTEEEEEYFANLESYSDDEPSSSKKPRKLKSYSVWASIWTSYVSGDLRVLAFEAKKEAKNDVFGGKKATF
ncbi:hypothetical protein DdX_13038 [Ditylenchus destructor]|uniref:Uncharacterized protein n=1 Tax=Ditylenchus destructor TaxID=166010 RepID=A0AAD4MXE2_9BILA|nr:hypothetical protein DdX_13038 [Ditylenchus destructor]